MATLTRARDARGRFAPAAKPAPLAGATRAVAVRRVRASYDAAATTDDNRRHWANADNLSADAAASPAIRAKLRSRARYEIANNSYARGIVRTLANDTIGTGPRLQMLTDDPDFNAEIEREFADWMLAVDYAGKLHTAHMAHMGDGEAFLALIANPMIDSSVFLDILLVEADRVTNDTLISVKGDVDGIRFDGFDNPMSYNVLADHPGGASVEAYGKAYTVPAEHMIHLFDRLRAGQHRGIPRLTPALPLFAQLRRYTLAVLAAAETAADFAGILYSDMPVNGEATQVDPLDSIEIERNMMTTMPAGWKLAQLEAEQPTTTYKEFKGEILNEIARALDVPFNVAAGNSSGYNYASGRLDWQVYYRSISIDQVVYGRRANDKIFGLWLGEYLKVRTSSRPVPEFTGLPRHQWFWNGTEHVDPQKEANAQETRLRNHTTTLAHEYARQGLDWEVQVRQRGKEAQLLKQLGLTTAAALPAPAVSDNKRDPEEEKDGDEE